MSTKEPGARRTEAERQELQQALAFSLSRAAGYGKALAAVLRKVSEAEGWVYAESWLASRDGQILKPGPVWPRIKAAFRDFREHSGKLGFLRGNGLPGRVLRSQAPEWVEDVSAAPKPVYGRQQLARETNLHAALALPVTTGREVLAVFVFYADRPMPVDASRIDFVSSVLSPLGPVLERKKTEDELRARARQQEAVANLGLEALEETSRIDQLIEKAIALFCRILEVDYGEVLALDPENGSFSLRTGGEPEPVSDGDDSHAGHTLAANEPVAVESFEKEKRFEVPQRLLDRDLASGLSVIIHGHNRPIGVTGAYARRRRRYTSSEVAFLQGVANVLGTAIERTLAEAELDRHRRHLEGLVRERTTKLESYYEQLRQAERLASIGTLAAGLGHDMKNVLLPVFCRLDALERGPLSAEAKGEVAEVRRSLDYLRQLSHGLRLFALNPEDPDASDDVTRLDLWWEEVGPLLIRALPKEVEFKHDLPSSLPAVRVPQHRLSQAVLNLVVNAGEATDGRGRVRLWAEAAEGGCSVRLGVTDDGHGMSRDVQRHALEPFFTTQTRGLSTGLGLSLVHGVAKSAGGSVQIDSAAGRGTTVLLTLPAVEEAPRAANDAAAPDDGPRVATVSLKDRRIAAFVSTLLRSAGFVVRADEQPGQSLLWITAARAKFLPDALSFLERNPNRRVIVLGKPPGAESWPRLSYVESPLDLEGLRQSLRQLVHELLETTDVF